ncbi:MAG TPA: hypothetical protein VGP82_04980, partial [Ktedonobacterales bacterium]|nr:hypothetical protein [Ktedonobacterales bacterium]
RLALLGVSFFAVLFALIVFMGGTFGRGWRHFFLVPGVVLAAPSLVVFVQSARMTSALLTQLGLALPIQVLVFAYLFLDALLLSLLLTDVRPGRRKSKSKRLRARKSSPRDRQLSNSRPRGGESSGSISELPVVRFELSSPFEVETKSSDEAAEAKLEDTQSEVLV